MSFDHKIKKYINSLPKSFTFEKLISDTGTYGTVLKVIDNDSGESRAIKFYKNQSFKDRSQEIFNVEAIREIAASRQIGDINGVIFSKVHFLEPDSQCVLEMPYVQNTLQAYNYTSVATKIATINWIMPQLLQTLASIHRQGLIHNDIKLDNILIDMKRKMSFLIDFGLSGKPSLLNCCIEYCFPVNFRPFEVEMGSKYHDSKADIWALGVSCLYFIYKILFANYADLFSRIPSMKSELPINTPELIATQNIYFDVEYMNRPSITREIPDNMKSMFRDMLNLDPRKRLSAVELLNKYYKIKIPLLSKRSNRVLVLPNVNKQVTELVTRIIPNYIIMINDELYDLVVKEVVKLYHRVDKLQLYDDETNVCICLYIVHMLYDSIVDNSKIKNKSEFKTKVINVMSHLNYDLYVY